MGLFGGLFQKKTCSICGGEIGLLGNRKLEDGNLCKNCAAKLSPWFDERRHSTVEQIAAQLKYREENREKVKAFSPTYTVGELTKLLIDEDHGWFMVTKASDLEAANPDVVDLKAVTNCMTDMSERKTELKEKNAEGKLVSYNPPRYDYYYDFRVKISVNHPYFDDMNFQMNPSAVKVTYLEQRNAGLANIRRQPTGISGAVIAGINSAMGTNTGVVCPNVTYQKYLDMANQGVNYLLSARAAAMGAGTQAAGTQAAGAEAIDFDTIPAEELRARLSDPAVAAEYVKYLEKRKEKAYQDLVSSEAAKRIAAENGNDQAAIAAKAEAQAQAELKQLTESMEKAKLPGTPGLAAAAAPAAAAVKVKCPFCGSETTPTPEGHCEFCDAPLK